MRVAGRVGPPAGHGQPAAGAVPAAGVGHHDGVLAVRQQVRPRGRRVGAGEPAADRLRLGRRRGPSVSSSGWRISGASSGTRSCNSSSTARTAGSARSRRQWTSPSQPVGDGAQAHALVVGHVRLDDLAPLARGRAGPGCSRSPRRTRTAPRRRRPAGPRSSRPPPWRRPCTASSVAYGATTRSLPSPRFSPSPGTPNDWYW